MFQIFGNPPHRVCLDPDSVLYATDTAIHFKDGSTLESSHPAIRSLASKTEEHHPYADLVNYLAARAKSNA